MRILTDILEFNHTLRDGRGPYCFRWVINFGLFSLRIHRWVKSDVHEHTHPYWMLIVCIKGGYLDKGEKRDKLIAPCIRFRKPSHKHKVIIPLNHEVWTFVITGPKLYKWHLYRDGKKLSPNKYFQKS